MSKKISVICAAVHKTNPGMLSVDAAFYFFAQKYLPDVEIEFLKICDDSQPQLNDSSQDFGLPFKYGILRGNLDELYKSDAIIFWGDFFHMAHYRKDEIRRQLKLGNVKTIDEGLQLVDRYFFLTDAPEDVRRKVIIFGENLLFNQAGDYTSVTYETQLKNLLSTVAYAKMRDVFSALAVQHITGNYDRSYLGTDCAMLLDMKNLDELFRNNPSSQKTEENTIGVFFHRNMSVLSKQLKFAKKLSKVTGQKAQWLPWRHNRRIDSAKRWSFPMLEFSHIDATPSLGDILDMVSGCSFVISDTYHLCVNAWNMGIPAVCIGMESSSREVDVSCGAMQAWRDKRRTFYSMFEALKFYVNVCELQDSTLRNTRIAQLAKSLRNRNEIDFICGLMRNHTAHAEKQLADAIKNVLNG